MSTVAGYLEYRGGCSVPWGYHDKCGGYLEYHGGVQYRGGSHEYRGGYLEYRGGCSVPWGDITVLNIPHGTQDNPPRYS